MTKLVKFTYTTKNESMRDEVAKAFAALAAIGLGLPGLLLLLLIGSYGGRLTPVSFDVVAGLLTGAFLAWRAAHFIGSGRPRHARIALVCQAPIAILLLLGALQASSHSDGKLLVFGLAVECCALVAFVLGRAA